MPSVELRPPDMGALEYVATEGGRVKWTNPLHRHVSIRISPPGYLTKGIKEQLVDRKFKDQVAFVAKDIDGRPPWIAFDLHDMRVRPVQYRMCHRDRIANYFMRNWVLEGSADGSFNDAVVLSEHRNDSTINDKSFEGYFKCNRSNSKKFRFLRIRATGSNSGGNTALVLSCFEVWGEVSLPDGSSSSSAKGKSSEGERVSKRRRFDDQPVEEEYAPAASGKADPPSGKHSDVTKTRHSDAGRSITSVHDEAPRAYLEPDKYDPLYNEAAWSEPGWQDSIPGFLTRLSQHDVSVVD